MEHPHGAANSPSFHSTPLAKLSHVPSRNWLRANPRPALVLALPLALCGAALAALGMGYPLGAGRIFLLASGMAALLIAAVTATLTLRPRLRQQGDRLRFQVRWLGAEEVPLEAVEGFLLGTGELPVSVGGRPVEAATLVVKLADAELPWADRPTNRMLAQWCDHYVRVRGVFCEPLSVRLVEGLNARLAEARRESVR